MMAFVTTGFAQKKMLVLWYSETGTTTELALQINRQLTIDGKIPDVASDVVMVDGNPYTGNFQETVQRAQQEKQNGTLPKLKPLTRNINDYDIIFLGYPIWSGTYASPIAALVKEYDFAGKTVVPFCTFGSGGLNTSSADLKKALPKAKVMPGFGARAARVKNEARGKANPVWKELNRFLIENEYIKGNLKPLPAYSEQKPVTDEERAIFDAACSSYQFPLGTPQTVGKRITDDGIDYEFKVKSRGFGGGAESTSTIYVTVGKEEGAKPEFTEVVR